MIHEIENTWIPLNDGTRLAARIWLPHTAEDDPVPALLEYLPYRKNDGTAVRDALRHPYLAAHGYACVRVDMRGSGDAGGILYDEYLPQEQDDALEVLAWIAAQPWCDGNIGMFGISWGGFNALQVAARRPPQLKAIITICSTDDRYADDVHYMGGCVLGSQMLSWASVMFNYNACPPDPRFVGGQWRQMWLERMEKTPPFVEAWLNHQRRDAFWRHGSVCEDFGAVDIPVYAIGGWADAYTNAIPRLLAGLSGPRKGLIGPWAHAYPDQGVPGPAIGFNQESLRWWDYWLKGIDTGIMDEPMLRAWMLDSQPPASSYQMRPGHWVAETGWPPGSRQVQTLYLNGTGLAETAEPETPLSLTGHQATGLLAGEWCAYGREGDFPPDQQAEDGRCLSFTGHPVSHPVEILGFPQVTLTLQMDRPQALVAVRLLDVAPTGESTLVSWGLLNLTHRRDHEQPQPLQPDKRYTVNLHLNAIGYQLPVGHAWRLAVSPTYWPHAWPSPQPVTLTLFTGNGSELRLPVRSPQPLDDQLRPFPPPKFAPHLATETLRPASRRRTIEHDVIGDWHTLTLVGDYGRIRYSDNGLEVDHQVTERYTIRGDDPLSAAVHIERQKSFRRGDWQVRIETRSQMTADATHFHLTNHLDAYEGNGRIFTKSWSKTIPRDAV
jgi:uncharacterized protein